MALQKTVSWYVVSVFTRHCVKNGLDKVFQDGVYLELISFTHPASHYPPGSPERRERESIPWASKSPGWIDYAFLGSSTTSISHIINERARQDGSGAEYLPEQKGGRQRPDGNELVWVISAPRSGLVRGVVPFFCGDVTPRKWRVSRSSARHGMVDALHHSRRICSTGSSRAAFEHATSIHSDGYRTRAYPSG